MTDFHNYDTIHKLSVEVDITKRITRHDLIFQLLNDDEIAFKSSDGSSFIIDTKRMNEELFNLLIKESVLSPSNKKEVGE